MQPRHHFLSSLLLAARCLTISAVTLLIVSLCPVSSIYAARQAATATTAATVVVTAAEAGYGSSISASNNNGTGGTSAAITQGIDRIINKYGSGINVGVFVQSLNSGKVIYQRNATQLFSPASSLKVFTAAAALAHLGADYTFKTRILAAPKSINAQGELNSDVYFYFDGDPTLTRGNLNALVAALRQLGVRAINGNIYLDDTVFDRVEFGPGWMWDERNFCYAAPVSGINIDHNCFPFGVTAASTAGQPLSIARYKGYGFLDFVNNGVTTSAAYEDCPLTISGNEENTYTVNGCMKAGAGTWSFPMAVWSMRPYAVGVFTELLRQNNISFNGSIKFGAVPADKSLIAMIGHDSVPLSAIIRVMLKKSDNLFADAVFKKLGASYFGKTGTWSNSSRALMNILSGAHIDFAKLKIVDGCGLSRHNLVSPQALVALLNYAYRNASIRDTFIAALPEAGVDGHLQGRMVSIKNRVHAKTGNMKSITTLAGYVYTNNNQVLSFAIMVNDFVEHVNKYHGLEDEICTLLARQ